MSELERLREEIKQEKPFVNRKPYSHNIISLCLRQIESKYGEKSAKKAISDLKLKRLGWS